MNIHSTFGCRDHSDRVGVLLAQVGTPDAPTAPALRRYLKQFLSDPRVIEVNRYLWWIILNGIILQLRPKRSAKLYARVWEKDGSPLLRITAKQTEKLQARFGQSAQVEFGMRCGNPSLESQLDKLIDGGCTRIVLVPMFPQYAAATTASAYDAIFPHLLKRRWVPTLKVVEPFFAHPLYIQALAECVGEFYEQANPRPERLLVSYHGVPTKYVLKGDPYCCMCTETTALLRKVVALGRDELIQTFQSRFGNDPWLTPATDKTVEKLAEDGVKRLAVVCPAFVADCLETLDEIGNEANHLFKEHGGEELKLVPCVNDRETFIDCLEAVVRETGGSWFEEDKARVCGNAVVCPSNCFQREAV